MFHTIGYKGHFIHVSIERGVETVKTLTMRNDGGFDLERRRTLVRETLINGPTSEVAGEMASNFLDDEANRRSIQ
ncbi:hypothetical protein KTE60_31400 [Burkholderia multivorans]|uniref:hypothetical protein n=1 Tax=Burkholderia multivorans TaxID=87883 RepID=UPI001C24F081|nr:hypothetical protein [Burkholderia multivorans]MBU9633795.1 hypothetical protein [Burkholderia multivorans]